MMLPNASGAVVTLFALQAFGRVPAMLNFSAGAPAMTVGAPGGEVRTVLTSRAFVAMAKLERAGRRHRRGVEFVWLEDVSAEIGPRAKLRGLWDRRRAHAAGAIAVRRCPGGHAVHQRIGGHAQRRGAQPSRHPRQHRPGRARRIDFGPADRVLNALPVFHAFGLTGGTLLPLLSGIARVPLSLAAALPHRAGADLRHRRDHPVRHRHVPRRLCAHGAHPYDFRTLRYVFAGAEKVRDETRRVYAEKFGVRILEGYGATETGAGARDQHADASTASARSAGCCRASTTQSSRSPASRKAAGWSCAARTSCWAICAPTRPA